MTELVGRLEVRTVGVGSKSEMPAVVLVPDDPSADGVPLRRRESTALDAEAELVALAGRRVRVVGTQGWQTFVVDEIEVQPEDH
ncbi:MULTISPECIES: hypothetical protein [unclassified Nocardioides]|uniref:hypothetical protein n=1 Tax=unclassified Nocardioides TaxID=2615069 RepID=UPI003612C98F